MSDFERAPRNAARQVWPDCDIQGCNFHFCQAIRRKTLEFPLLKEAMKINSEARLIVKMLQRLSLLPIGNVIEGLEYIGHRIIRFDLQQVFVDFMR